MFGRQKGEWKNMITFSWKLFGPNLEVTEKGKQKVKEKASKFVKLLKKYEIKNSWSYSPLQSELNPTLMELKFCYGKFISFTFVADDPK